MKEQYLTPQTKWELYTFDQLAEIAEWDDVKVDNVDDVKAYLDNRNDVFYKHIGDDKFDVLFA